jgi:Cyclic nucleotide-binding domain
MGGYKAFPHGQAIVRQGEMGNEMFVLINGKAEVQVTVNGHSRVVRELNRGDVLVKRACYVTINGRRTSLRPRMSRYWW